MKDVMIINKGYVLDYIDEHPEHREALLAFFNEHEMLGDDNGLISA